MLPKVINVSKSCMFYDKQRLEFQKVKTWHLYLTMFSLCLATRHWNNLCRWSFYFEDCCHCNLIALTLCDGMTNQKMSLWLTGQKLWLIKLKFGQFWSHLSYSNIFVFIVLACCYPNFYLLPTFCLKWDKISLWKYKSMLVSLVTGTYSVNADAGKVILIKALTKLP